MKKTINKIKKNHSLIIVGLSLFFVTVSIFNARNDALTFDEVAHIPAGYSYLLFHDMRLNPEHPPLLKDLAALPLLVWRPRFNIEKDFWQKDINGQWSAGHDLLWQENNNADQIAFWSRLPIILISLLLGLFVFKWTKELAGLSAGILAFLLFVFDPNILGHNHFVTTDIGIAAFLTFSFYYFVKFIIQPSWKNTFLGGLFLGLAHVTKFSSITLIPVYALILFLYPLLKAQPEEKKLSRSQLIIFRLKNLAVYLAKGSMALLFSLVIVWLVYLPNVWQADSQVLRKTIEHSIYPQSWISDELKVLSQHRLTRPFSEYGLGLKMVFQRVAGGNGVYYFGKVSGQAFPSYFPVVFILKETLGFLLLLVVAFLFFLLSWPKIIQRIITWLRPKQSAEFSFQSDFTLVSLFLLSTYVILYTYISVTGNLNIGLRHLFPIFPPLIILISVVLVKAESFFFSRHRFFYRTVLTLFVLSIVIETVSAYPYYLSFFNRAVGGPKNGYHYVTDSNADWGQDLKRLKKYLDKHPEIKEIRVDYFGGGNPQYYLGSKFIPWWENRRPIQPGYYAISTNVLMGSLYNNNKPDNQTYRWIVKNNLKPIAQVGTSILIYKVDKEIK